MACKHKACALSYTLNRIHRLGNVMKKTYFDLCVLLAVFFVLTVGLPKIAVGGGTGFAVAPGLIVTNDHVIDRCGKIEVIAADGRRPAVLIDTEPVIDLALLRVYGLGGAVARLRSETPVMLGEGVMVFGFPLTGALSSTGNFTAGNVSSLRGLNDAAGVIQITAPIQPGNSGGPILDDRAQVIGVVRSKLDVLKAASLIGDIPQNVNFGISLPVLLDFLVKNKVSFEPGTELQPKPNVEIAKEAQSFTYRIACTEEVKSTSIAKPSTPNSSGIARGGDPLTASIQSELNRLGYNAGKTDGLLGPQTRSAIMRAEKSLRLPVTGLPSRTLLNRLRDR